MPELPEVETMGRQIRQGYLQRRIIRVKAKPVIIFQNVSARKFSNQLTGKILQQVQRYGKYLYWQVENLYPVFHLGMSGIFISQPEYSRYPRHIHISFYFEDGLELHFQDARKFGKVYLYPHPPDFSDLGPDPMGEKFTLNNFKKLLNLRKVSIKSLLMNQHMIAGIGNIYAAEALFAAGIHPLRPSGQLTVPEIRRLYASIRQILLQATERFGTTYTAYMTVNGSSGENQNFLQVYQREGENCPKCGRGIHKMMINNRSTFYCASCQK